ncbi:MAG: IS66 family transposase [Flavobacteriales bacterium]|nr:IS66 family transposase [Flavobacteriales bacterium]
MNYEAILAEKEAIIAAQNALLEKVTLDTSNRIQQLEHELAQLRKMIFGQKRERFLAEANANQLSLFSGDDVVLTEPVVEIQHIEYDRKTPKKHPGRTELPEHLPVEIVIIEPEEDTTGMKRIGEEITETLEYTQASLVKKRTIRPKYAKPDGEGVVIGKLPSRPIPKAIAEASLIAYILVSKFIDHLPFYRLIQLFKREYRWEVSDSTINEWFVAVCTLLHPLYEVLQRKVLSNGYLQVDESPIKVLDQDKPGGTHQGYQWVYYSPELKLVFFNYRKGRGQHGPKEILKEYQGILQADGWQVYDKIAEIPGITLAGCVAHARRYFDKSKQSNKAKSEEVLTIIQRIYAQERMCKEMSPEDRKIFRKNQVKPIFEELRQWLDEELKGDITPKSDYGQAITYLNKQWHKLIKVLENGRIEIDNNLIENKIRPLALGRKNYLFAGSHDAAQRIAMMYSFFGSCKAHDINPYEWLKETLELIPETKLSELHKLLPGGKM